VAGSPGSGRVVIHVREVTAERKMLDQITRSEKMATVGKLAAGLAHEINNPLGVILCYAELLKQTATPEQKQDLEVIISHTSKAREVLKNLLNFARPKVSRDRDTDIADMAETVSTVFSPQAQKTRGRDPHTTNGSSPARARRASGCRAHPGQPPAQLPGCTPGTGGEIIVRHGIRQDRQRRWSSP
jgi:two-component system, NtrC family, sensor kinase